jgi:hypothetical protein
MARIPFEFAVDKRAIEGMVSVLREVRRGPGPRSRSTPLYFVSASPAQLRPVIERRMLLDGLEFDGTTFKDWIGVVRSWRLRRLREQVGFKLTALLHRRQTLPRGAQETLIGDDLERDGYAYALYADILAGRLAGDALQSVLARADVAEGDARAIGDSVRAIGECAGVRRGYLRLERHQPEAFLSFAPHVVACRSALQMALSLWRDGCISIDGVVRVGRDLLRSESDRARLTEQLGDCCCRAILDGDQGREAMAALKEAGLADAKDLPEADERWAARRDHPEERWASE